MEVYGAMVLLTGFFLPVCGDGSPENRKRQLSTKFIDESSECSTQAGPCPTGSLIGLLDVFPKKINTGGAQL